MTPKDERLLGGHPLNEGEELVDSLDAAWLNEEFEHYSDARLLLTTERFGSINEHQPFFVPLHDIVGFLTEDDLLQISYANGVVQTYRAADPSGFVYALLMVRQSVLTPEAHGKWVDALRLMQAARWKQAVPLLEAAGAADPFHVGPEIVKALIQRRLGRAHEAAETLLAHLLSIVDLLPQLVLLPLSFRLAGHHLHTLERLCGDVDAEDSHVLLVLLATVLARRRGQFDRFQLLIDRAYVRAEGSPRAMTMVVVFGLECAPAELWPRLAEIHEEAAREARNQGSDWVLLSEEAVALIRDLADYDTDPCKSARASTQFEELLGEPSEDGAPWRALEDWDAVLNERSQRTVFPEEAVARSAYDIDAFGSLIEWVSIVANPVVDVEHCWGILRAQRGPLKLRPEPAIWWRRIAQSSPPDSPKVWLAGLVAVEQCLRKTVREDADRLLKEIYQHCSVVIGDTRDIYTRWASSLYGLYSGLARNDVMAVRMYEDILRHHPGFGWTDALCEHLLGQRWKDQRAPAPSVAAFEAWSNGANRLLRLHDEPHYLTAKAALSEARASKSLRVVVGGETSSGKSSFINALLGAPVLFVTAEEATAVPTSVSFGTTWSSTVVSAQGSEIARIDVGSKPGDEDRERFKTFVEEYSALSSGKIGEVSALRITSPDVDLPPGVELFDTPGLNAHAVRTKVAQATIDNAHACIFVLDAGAALKAGEMSKIQWASEAVGKTVFVINKMDRAIGDDDLDVDDDAAEDLLSRVREELAASLGTEGVNVFAVCSLSEDRLRRIGAPPETVAYARAVREVHAKLNHILSTSREQLVEYAAGKVARVVAEIALDRSHAEIARHDTRMAELSYSLPGDPGSFRAHVMSMVAGVWGEARDTYIENMRAAMEGAAERADQRMISGIQGCSDNEQLRGWVKRSARPILNDFVADVDRARTEQWTAVGEVVLDVVRALFEALYRDVQFEPCLDASALVELATPLPLARPGRSLDNALESLIGDQVLAQGGGAAAGALIGTFILPGLGTMVGGWLGGMAGGAAAADPSQGVYEKINEQLVTCYESAAEALDADMAAPDGELAPILKGLTGGIEVERKNFERALRAEISRIKGLRKKSQDEGQALRKAAVEAWDFSWQFRRRLEAAAIDERES